MTTLPRRAIEQSLSNGDQWNAQLRCFLNHQSEFSHKHNTRAIYLYNNTRAIYLYSYIKGIKLYKGIKSYIKGL